MVVASATAQTIAYIFRILSIQNPANFGDYAAWFVLILVRLTLHIEDSILKTLQVAPLLTNAFLYMVMGRMVWNYIAEAKLYRITAWRFGMYFVIFDIWYVALPCCCAYLILQHVQCFDRSNLRSSDSHREQRAPESSTARYVTHTNAKLELTISH